MILIIFRSYYYRITRKFEEYFNDLISLIMPIDYKNNDIGIINYISILDEIKKFN